MHSAVPDRVSGVRFVPSPGENSLSVEWSRPQSDFPILYYEIQFRRQIGEHTWQRPVNATTESLTLQTNPTPTTSWGVRVRAVSAIGVGPYSIEVIEQGAHSHTHNTHKCTYSIFYDCIYSVTLHMKILSKTVLPAFHPIVPGPVSELSYEENTNTSVNVTWKPPKEPNGYLVAYFVEHGVYQNESTRSKKINAGQAMCIVIRALGKLLLQQVNVPAINQQKSPL